MIYGRCEFTKKRIRGLRERGGSVVILKKEKRLKITQQRRYRERNGGKGR